MLYQVSLLKSAEALPLDTLEAGLRRALGKTLVRVSIEDGGLTVEHTPSARRGRTTTPPDDQLRANEKIDMVLNAWIRGER